MVPPSLQLPPKGGRSISKVGNNVLSSCWVEIRHCVQELWVSSYVETVKGQTDCQLEGIPLEQSWNNQPSGSRDSPIPQECCSLLPYFWVLSSLPHFSFPADLDCLHLESSYFSFLLLFIERVLLHLFSFTISIFFQLLPFCLLSSFVFSDLSRFPLAL